MCEMSSVGPNVGLKCFVLFPDAALVTRWGGNM